MRKKIQIGMIWAIAFLLLFPVGSVMAGDVSTDNDTGTTITCIVQTAAVINSASLRNAANTSVDNQMIDVNNQYHFYMNITQKSGWSDIKYVNITVWYDSGTDPNYPSTPTTTTNTQFRLVYNNTGTSPWWGLATNPTAGNEEVTFDAHAEYVHNTTTHHLNFTFTPKNAIRHAAGDGTWNAATDHSTTSGGLNDAYSWNYEVNVTNVNNVKTSWYDEFGVYLYTNVTASGDPSGTGAPGQTIDLLIGGVANTGTTVTYSANDQYTLTVGINNLTSGANTITADNVSVKGGNIGSYTAFTVTGPPLYTQDLYTNQAPYATGANATTTTYWQVFIPYGTAIGTYTSQVTYSISA